MSLILSLIMFCVSTLFTPGPNNIMIMNSGLNYGIRKSLPHYFGIITGFPLMLIFIGLGLNSLFITFPFIQKVIKLIGICYILYLSWKIATTKTKANSSKKSKTTEPLTFLQAALFQWANPKAWVMAISAFSLFASLSDSLLVKTLIITGSFLFFGLLSAGTWLAFGVTLQKYLKHPKIVRNFNYLMALLLAASAVMLLFD